MRSGTKNCLVDIVQNVEVSKDSYNQPVYEPQVWRAEIFCNATPRRGREIDIEGSIQYESYMRFDFDYFDVEGVLPTMVIVHEGVEYGISGILPDIALKEWITVDATARPLGTERE